MPDRFGGMTIIALCLIVLGVVGILWSGYKTRRSIEQAGVPQKYAAETAGTGIVPKYLSAVNLGSWATLVLGVVLLLFL